MSGGNRNAPRMVMKPDFDFDMEWVDQAACAGAPTEIFFPNYHTQESIGPSTRIPALIVLTKL